MDTASLRHQMVEQQIASRGVQDPAVLAAMRGVPRERFVAGSMRPRAYEDRPLPIDEGQTISQPYIVALMAEALLLTPHSRVLEVGAGSGYAAAVLGQIASEVYAIERFAPLAQQAAERMGELGYDNVHILAGDGTLGLPEHAPFDAITVAAGGPEVPPSLLEQLTIGGHLVMPVGRDPQTQELMRVHRAAADRFETESLGAVKFVPLIGAEGWPSEGAPVGPRRPTAVPR